MPQMSVRGYLAALPSVIKQELDRQSFYIYVTDALKVISGNTARFNGGSEMSKRWIDVINTKVDNRTADEIAFDIMTNAGLSFSTEEGENI